MSDSTALQAGTSNPVRPRSRFRTWIKRLGILFLVWLGYRAVVLFAPSNRLKVGPTTTVLDGPLLPDGYVDYITYLNEKASQGVTPENNALLRLLETCPPDAIPEAHRSRLCQWLKVSELPVPKQPYVNAEEFGAAVDQRNLEEYQARELLMQGDDQTPPAPPVVEPIEEETESEILVPVSNGPLLFEKQVEETTSHPWTRDQYPDVADWLEQNQPTIDAWSRASQCDRLFDPLLAEPGAPLILVDTDFSFELYKANRVLVSKAYQLLGEGDVSNALELSLALHRMGRLIKNHGMNEYLHYLRGMQFESRAWDLMRQCLQHDKITPELASSLRRQLEQLPPSRSIQSLLLEVVRFHVIDSIIRSFTYTPIWLREMEIFAPRQIDANIFATWMNEKIEEQVKIMDSDEAPLVKSESLSNAWDVQRNISSVVAAWAILPRGAATRTAIKLYQGKFAPTQGLLLPRTIQHQIRQQVTLVACAIVEAELRDGKPPADLSELESVKKWIIDPVSRQPLKYQVNPQGGWLLYSVGVNGKDDNGEEEITSDWKIDDISIRRHWPSDTDPQTTAPAQASE